MPRLKPLEYSQDRFKRFAFYQNVVRVLDASKELREGRTSHLYFDWRETILRYSSRVITAKFVASFIKKEGIEPTSVVGVPNGSKMLGIEVQSELTELYPHMVSSDFPFVIAQKPDMTIKFSLSNKLPKKMIIQEDTTKYGLSSMKLALRLTELGVEEIDVVSLTERNQSTPIPGLDSEDAVQRFKQIFKEHSKPQIGYSKGMSVREAFQSLGIKFHSMSSGIDLYNEYLARNKGKVGFEIQKLIEKEYEVFGTKLLFKEQMRDRIKESELDFGLSSLLGERDQTNAKVLPF
ncbi:MAG: hypothetical protein ACREBF_00345 [Candidatus Micrarchaeales archaeon]